jgi:hypothetical protein
MMSVHRSEPEPCLALNHTLQASRSRASCASRGRVEGAGVRKVGEVKSTVGVLGEPHYSEMLVRCRKGCASGGLQRGRRVSGLGTLCWAKVCAEPIAGQRQCACVYRTPLNPRSAKFSTDELFLCCTQYYECNSSRKFVLSGMYVWNF